MTTPTEARECANCAFLFNWPPTITGGQVYCCVGCAEGGPCTCTYAEPLGNSPGPLLYGFAGRPSGPVSFLSFLE